MMKFKFIDEPQLYQKENAFVVHLSGIQSEEQLFSKLNKKLEFPDYFGFNWDALLDLFCDFHWIKQKDIVLIHDEFPVLEEESLNTYVHTLIEAKKSWRDWKEGEAHYLEIVFPKSSETLLKKYLKEGL